MKSTLWWLGVIFATLSVVLLARQGWDLGLSAPLQTMIVWYGAALTTASEFVRPFFVAALRVFNASLGLTWELKPSWHHYFVIVMIIAPPVFRGVLSLVSAQTWWTNISQRIAWALGFIYALYNCVYTDHTRFPISAPGVVDRSAVIALFLLVVVAVIGLLFLGAVQAAFERRDAGFGAALGKTASLREARLLVGVVFGVAAFVAINAGLKLAGL